MSWLVLPLLAVSKGTLATRLRLPFCARSAGRAGCPTAGLRLDGNTRAPRRGVPPIPRPCVRRPRPSFAALRPRKQQRADEGQGFALWTQGHPRHHASMTHRPPSVWPGCWRVLGRPIPAADEGPMRPEGATPTEHGQSSCRVFASTEGFNTLRDAWQIEVVDVVSRDDVGVLFEHQPCHALQQF